MLKWLKRKIKAKLSAMLADDINRRVWNETERFRHDLATLKRRLESASEIGVDLHVAKPEETTIWILSRFGEGRIEHIDVQISSPSELVKLVRYLKDAYGSGRTYVDAIPSEARAIRAQVGG